MFRKITSGFVVQEYNDKGEFICQSFVAGDNVDYEKADGTPLSKDEVPEAMTKHHPFDMK